MKQLARLLAVAFAIAIAPSFAQQKFGEADARYLARLATMNIAEAQAARLAASKAGDPRIKHFAREILVEHEQELDELQQIAARKGAKLPSEADARHRAALKRLEAIAGDEFDRAYVDQTVKDHEQADRLSQTVARRAQDPDLKALAKKTSSRMKQHLLSARRIESSIRGGPAAEPGARAGGSSGN